MPRKVKPIAVSHRRAGKSLALSTVARNAAALLPWSYSKLSEYEKCPRKAFYRYVERLPEGKSDALDRGNRVHAELETWAKGGFLQHKLNPAWRRFAKEAKRMKLPEQPDVVVEQMWRFNDALQPVEAKAPDEWLRVKCDLAVPGLHLIVDHKTGKKYPEHKHQGTLYGVSYLAMFPQAPGVDVEFWYVDLGDVGSMRVERNDVARVLAETKIKVRDMIEDVEFRPNPTRLCDWCSFSRTKGGPCREG